MLRKILTWTSVLVVAVYAFTDPHGMGAFIHGLLGVIPLIGRELANFAGSL